MKTRCLFIVTLSCILRNIEIQNWSFQIPLQRTRDLFEEIWFADLNLNLMQGQFLGISSKTGLCFSLLFVMELLLKNLKEDVTCSICLDTHTKSKTISCLHTSCSEYQERHPLTSQKQGFEDFTDAPSVRHKLASLKESVLMICQAVFCTTVFWVFSPFDAAPKEIRSVVVHARRRARRSTTALIARSLCAGTVRKLCFRDTKWHRCDSFKPQTTRPYWTTVILLR